MVGFLLASFLALSAPDTMCVGHEPVHHLRDPYAGADPVPFFLMEEECAGYTECARQANGLEEYRRKKHGGELAFVEQLRSSSWRVHSPRNATLIVLPLYLGFTSRDRSCLKQLTAALRNVTQTPRFQERQGRDHLVAFSDFKATIPGGAMDQLAIMHARVTVAIGWDGRFREASMHSCFARVPMMSIAGAALEPGPSVKAIRRVSERLSAMREMDTRSWVASRELSYIFAGKVLKRTYSQRLFIRDSLQRLKGRLPLPALFHASDVGQPLPADQYTAALATSTFGLHPGGDIPSGDRLYGALDTGVIPVVVCKDCLRTGVPAARLPWCDLVLEAPATHGADLDRALARIAQYGANTTLLAALRENARFLAPRMLWDVPDSRVAETILIDLADKCDFGSARKRGEV
jgi:hypothetical protein